MPRLSLGKARQYACRSGGALFQSIAYVLIFLVCVATLTKVSAPSVRRGVLLLASVFLYLTWTRWFAAVLLLSIVMNFVVGKWLRRNPAAVPLWTGIVLNLALLAAFKYLPELSFPFPSLQAFAHLALPLGISFWTFQALSYLFDLYRGEDLDPSFSEFALYMAFFPVTISGPVCRMPEMLPQFRSGQKTPWSAIVEGFRRIAMGALMTQLAKLLGQGILAGDGIASGFDRVTNWTGADAWCLAIGYGLQLFFDFAGYSHIAIGAAKALGIDVPENFQRPFASTSPSIFWTRWHISLSFWIRDYVFLPLAVLRREIWWRHFVLILSMVLFGLWHRASLLFLLWGAYHGVLLVLHRLVQQTERRFNWAWSQSQNPHPVAKDATRAGHPQFSFADGTVWNLLSWITTMALVSLGWIFFRANSWSQASRMLSAMGSPRSYGAHVLSASLYLLVAALSLGYALTIVVADAVKRRSEETPGAGNGLDALARWRWFWIAPLYALAMLFVLMITSTQSGGVGQFMYRGF